MQFRVLELLSIRAVWAQSLSYALNCNLSHIDDNLLYCVHSCRGQNSAVHKSTTSIPQPTSEVLKLA